jgi:predicted RNA-binding Zn-ribbon protein involved in translation (DUF1610 family)
MAPAPATVVNLPMMSEDRPPVRDCPRCGVAMVSRKTDARSVGDDTYECAFCGTVVNFSFEKPKPTKAAVRTGS